jgi:hypothetical protein
MSNVLGLSSLARGLFRGIQVSMVCSKTVEPTDTTQTKPVSHIVDRLDTSLPGTCSIDPEPDQVICTSREQASLQDRVDNLITYMTCKIHVTQKSSV